jgi:NAD(P)-dependent dehydrogenase (short-subunit alcohol dehydrogenase family)
MKNQNVSASESVEGKQKVAVVTGSSSGIGFSTALHLARAGYFTFATMRNPAAGIDLIKAAENENLPIQVEQLDVTDFGEIKDFMSRIGESSAAVAGGGRVDVLVNNAGYVLLGSLEDLSIKEIQDQLDTNLLGTIRVTQQVLSVMRAQSSGGTIVNISSAAGRFGLPGMSAYVSSKFALEGLSESLAYEVAPFGINVVLVEPGVVKTKIFKNTIVGQGAGREDSPYSSLLGSLNASFEALMENASTADQVAAIVLQAVSSPKPRLRYPAGQDVNSWLEKKSTMTDEQFQEYMKNMMSSVVAPSHGA